MSSRGRPPRRTPPSRPQPDGRPRRGLPPLFGRRMLAIIMPGSAWSSAPSPRLPPRTRSTLPRSPPSPRTDHADHSPARWGGRRAASVVRVVVMVRPDRVTCQGASQRVEGRRSSESRAAPVRHGDVLGLSRALPGYLASQLFSDQASEPTGFQANRPNLHRNSAWWARRASQAASVRADVRGNPEGEARLWRAPSASIRMQVIPSRSASSISEQPERIAYGNYRRDGSGRAVPRMTCAVRTRSGDMLPVRLSGHAAGWSEPSPPAMSKPTV